MATIIVPRDEIIDTTAGAGSDFVGPGGTYTSRSFFVGGGVINWISPYLLVWYTTGYPLSAQNHARVLINGTNIGTLPPHPWQGQGSPDDTVVARPFNANLLRIFTFPCVFNPTDPACVNTVTINPPPGNTGFEYLWVRKVIVHYSAEYSV
jgi:hypothetical protein